MNILASITDNKILRVLVQRLQIIYAKSIQFLVDLQPSKNYLIHLCQKAPLMFKNY